MISARFRWLQTRVRRLLRRRHQETEMEAEMRFHFDQLVAEFEAQGMSPERARQAAHREWGTSDAYREEMRDTWRPPLLSDFWRSIVFAIRSLARTPGFTAMAIVTLGLGIGANTSMFSVLNSVIYKPLPYRDPGMLDHFYRGTSQEDPRGRISPADFRDLQLIAADYGEVAAETYFDASLSEPGRPAEIAAAREVTVNFFSVLGVPPALGRSFLPAESTPGNHRVVILSNRMWRLRFGAQDSLIGETVRINGEPHEVIGILPEKFNEWRHLGNIDVFRPIAWTEERATDRTTTSIRVIGRRAPQLDVATANSWFETFGERQTTAYPEQHEATQWFINPLMSVVAGTSGPTTLVVLVALSGFVVLIACSNLANLLLARTMSRAREFAIRGALGASRPQLLKPLLLESLLLSLAGGALALLVAQWFAQWLAFRSTGDNGEQVIIELDWSVFQWAFMASLVTALIFGLAPSLFALRLNINSTLKSGGRGTTGSRGHARLRQALIVGQFSLAMVLLTGAILMIRGIHDLNNRQEGWQADGIVTGTFLLPTAHYETPEKIRQFHRQTLEHLRALPGVTSASLSRYTPFLDWYDKTRFLIEGHPAPPPGHEPSTLINSVSTDYFTTVGTQLKRGRDFDARDDAHAPPVFIINEDFAQAVFGDTDPIGQRITFLHQDQPTTGEIIGVAQNVKSIYPEAVFTSFQLYRPLAQSPDAYTAICLQAREVTPLTLIDAVRRTMTDLDPDLPISDLQTAELLIQRANYQLAVLRDILAMFALLGLSLAALGIYGVIARNVTQRFGEFGIRIALGAQHHDIIRLVLASSLRLLMIGSILGLVGSLGIAKLLTLGFPNMEMTSLSTLVVATGILGAIALLATYFPARSVSRIDPTTALRAE